MATPSFKLQVRYLNRGFCYLTAVTGQEDWTVQFCSGSVSSDRKKGQKMC